MLAVAAALLMFVTPAQADIAGVVSIIDGDTSGIYGHRIRLHGSTRCLSLRGLSPLLVSPVSPEPVLLVTIPHE